MSKPNKPGELINVEVEAISMVSKAANGERFKIFKSAGEEPEQVQKDVIQVLDRPVPAEKTPDPVINAGEVEKGAVSDTYNAGKNSEKLDDAFDALRKVLKLGARYGNSNIPPETDVNKIRAALDDFRNVAGQILLGTETQPEQVIKAGRKVSSSRLEKLKNIQTLINDVLDGLDETRDEVIDIAENTNAASIQKAIADALKPLSEKVNDLNVEGIVKEALAPVITRIEKIENARGFSNRALESKQVEKSSSFWDGAF